MEIKEAKNFQPIHDFIQGEGVNISQKRYKDIQSIYAKVDTSLAEDTLMYEVYTRVFNTSQNYRFSYQPIKWAFSFTFLVKFIDFLYRIFSYVMV